MCNSSREKLKKLKITPTDRITRLHNFKVVSYFHNFLIKRQTQINNTAMMFSTVKLYHRTHFWGDEIQARRQPQDQHLHVPAIWTQAILKSSSHDRDSSSSMSSKRCYLGCCRGQGNRVVEINEQHLLQCHRGSWELYQVREFRGWQHNHIFYKFVLLPQCTNIYDLWRGDPAWIYIGKIDASMARIDLAHFLQSYFAYGSTPQKCNHKTTGTNCDEAPTVHAHVGIVTDYIRVGLGGRKANHRLYQDGKTRNELIERVPMYQRSLPKVNKDSGKTREQKVKRTPLAQRND